MAGTYGLARGDFFLENMIDLLPVALILLASGLVAGVLSGMLGVGGGIVVVPVLYYVYNLLGFEPSLVMHLAVGTSLATVVFTSARSARSHQKKGSLDLAVFKKLAPGVLVGSLVGSAIGSLVSGEILTGVFAVMAAIVSVNMGFGRQEWRIADQLPGIAGCLLMGMFIGGISVMAGLGAGTLGVTVMTLFGTPVHIAVGTAAALGVMVSFPGVIGFMTSGWGVELLPDFTIGYVNYLAFAFIIPTTLLAAPWGVSIAHSFSPVILKRVFAVFLAITSARMFWSLM